MSDNNTERDPRPLSDAAEGDFVLVRYTVGGPQGQREERFRLSVVRKVTARLLQVGTEWYYRASGLPRYRKVRSSLAEPTGENLAAWRKFRDELRAREAERRKDAEAWEKERKRQADVAARWLAKQTPDEILKHVGLQPLVDVYEYLDREKLL